MWVWQRTRVKCVSVRMRMRPILPLTHESFLREIFYFHIFAKVLSLESFPLYGIHKYFTEILFSPAISLVLPLGLCGGLTLCLQEAEGVGSRDLAPPATNDPFTPCKIYRSVHNWKQGHVSL